MQWLEAVGILSRAQVVQKSEFGGSQTHAEEIRQVEALDLPPVGFLIQVRHSSLLFADIVSDEGAGAW